VLDEASGILVVELLRGVLPILLLQNTTHTNDNDDDAEEFSSQLGSKNVLPLDAMVPKRKEG
jgi:hypothetical protein